jgi:uncharacterized protein (DUF2267 family)
MAADTGSEPTPRSPQGGSTNNRRTEGLNAPQSEVGKCAVIGRVAELLKISRPKARNTTRSVLRAVRDRLPHEVLVPFGEQLPLRARRLYFDGWESSSAPITTSLRQFVVDIERDLPRVCLADPFSAINAVLVAVREHIGTSQMRKVKQAFAPEMHGLFDASPSSVHPCSLRVGASSRRCPKSRCS